MQRARNLIMAEEHQNNKMMYGTKNSIFVAKAAEVCHPFFSPLW